MHLSEDTRPFTTWLLWDTYFEVEISMQDIYDGVHLGLIIYEKERRKLE